MSCVTVSPILCIENTCVTFIRTVRFSLVNTCTLRVSVVGFYHRIIIIIDILNVDVLKFYCIVPKTVSTRACRRNVIFYPVALLYALLRCSRQWRNLLKRTKESWHRKLSLACTKNPISDSRFVLFAA